MSSDARLELRVVPISAEVNAGRSKAVDIATQTLARLAAYAPVQPEVFIHRASDDEVLRQAREVDRSEERRVGKEC